MTSAKAGRARKGVAKKLQGADCPDGRFFWMIMEFLSPQAFPCNNSRSATLRPVTRSMGKSSRRRARAGCGPQHAFFYNLYIPGWTGLHIASKRSAHPAKRNGNGFCRTGRIHHQKPVVQVQIPIASRTVKAMKMANQQELKERPYLIKLNVSAL